MWLQDEKQANGENTKQEEPSASQQQKTPREVLERLYTARASLPAALKHSWHAWRHE